MNPCWIKVTGFFLAEIEPKNAIHHFEGWREEERRAPYRHYLPVLVQGRGTFKNLDHGQDPCAARGASSEQLQIILQMSSEPGAENLGLFAGSEIAISLTLLSDWRK